jgi:DNA-binding MarR family transcriptional regulator
MDIHERINSFVEDIEADIVKRLTETGDQESEISRLEEMFRAEFPMLPPEITHHDLAEFFIRDMAETIKHRKSKPQRPHMTTISIEPSRKLLEPNSPAKAGTKAPVPKRRQTIKYQFIRDDALRLTDRILFSYLCRVQKVNGKPTLNRLRRYTGYRHSTVLRSLKKLQERGYVDEKRTPLKLFKGVLVSRNGDDGEVVRNVVKMNRNKGYVIYAGWAVKTFGISRRTYFRYMGKQERVALSRENG